jgi:hypothetical protein
METRTGTKIKKVGHIVEDVKQSQRNMYDEQQQEKTEPKYNENASRVQAHGSLAPKPSNPGSIRREVLLTVLVHLELKKHIWPL